MRLIPARRQPEGIGTIKGRAAMYNEMIYRNQELKQDLAHADRKASYGWRVWNVQSRESRLIDSAFATVGKALVAMGQRLMARRSAPVASGQLRLTSTS
jgi:hypothetical protein